MYVRARTRNRPRAYVRTHARWRGLAPKCRAIKPRSWCSFVSSTFPRQRCSYRNPNPANVSCHCRPGSGSAVKRRKEISNCNSQYPDRSPVLNNRRVLQQHAEIWPREKADPLVADVSSDQQQVLAVSIWAGHHRYADATENLIVDYLLVAP